MLKNTVTVDSELTSNIGRLHISIPQEAVPEVDYDDNEIYKLLKHKLEEDKACDIVYASMLAKYTFDIKYRDEIECSTSGLSFSFYIKKLSIAANKNNPIAKLLLNRINSIVSAARGAVFKTDGVDGWAPDAINALGVNAVIDAIVRNLYPCMLKPDVGDCTCTLYIPEIYIVPNDKISEKFKYAENEYQYYPDGFNNPIETILKVLSEGTTGFHSLLVNGKKYELIKANGIMLTLRGW